MLITIRIEFQTLILLTSVFSIQTRFAWQSSDPDFTLKTPYGQNLITVKSLLSSRYYTESSGAHLRRLASGLLRSFEL